MAAKDQEMAFLLPKNPEEGSFSLASDNNDTNVRFQCRTVDTLAASRSWNHIDILKMDIEGFEYEILESVSSWQTSVDQICVEIHVKNSSGTIHSVWDAVSLFWRLRRQGYAIIYNSAMDFTFARTDFTKRKNTVVR